MSLTALDKRWLATLAHSFARAALILYLVWAGAMKFTAFEAAAVSEWLMASPLEGIFGDLLATPYPSWLQGGLMLAAAILILPIWPERMTSLGLKTVMLLFTLPLLYLLTNDVWIDSLGGFPAIGSGQGLIKYIAMIGLAMSIRGRDRHIKWGTEGSPAGDIIMLLGVVLVLAWIGGMKFTAVEARGIAPLLSSSIFFRWMTDMFEPQAASDIIGVIELVTAALLFFGWWLSRRMFILGALMAGATFILTLSFLVSLPGWHADLDFPYIAATGQFLLKDLLLLAAVFILGARRQIRE